MRQVLEPPGRAAARRGRLHARRGARRGTRSSSSSRGRRRSGNRARSTATTCGRTAGSSASSSAASRASVAGPVPPRRRSPTRSASTSGSGCPRRSSRASRASSRRRPTCARRSHRFGDDCCSRACSPTRRISSATTTCGTPAQLHAAELPSSNGIGDARALARLYASCIGEVDGSARCTPATVAHGHAPSRCAARTR